MLCGVGAHCNRWVMTAFGIMCDKRRFESGQVRFKVYHPRKLYPL
jgi:hypothetical protein